MQGPTFVQHVRGSELFRRGVHRYPKSRYALFSREYLVATPGPVTHYPAFEQSFAWIHRHAFNTDREQFAHSLLNAMAAVVLPDCLSNLTEMADQVRVYYYTAREPKSYLEVSPYRPFLTGEFA